MNVKQGDLAIIVGATVAPENNGRIVEVVRPFLQREMWGDTRKETSEPAWLVRSAGSPLAIVRFNTMTLEQRTFYVPERPYPDRCLRPIRPQPDDAVDEMVKLVGKPKEVTT